MSGTRMHDEIYNCLFLGCRDHGYNYGRGGTKMDYTDRYVVIKTSALVKGMDEIALRVFLITGGFGAKGSALSLREGKCFGSFVFDDSNDYIYRVDIERLATADEIKIAKDYLLTKKSLSGTI